MMYDKYYEHYKLVRDSDGEVLATVSAPSYQAASPFSEAAEYAKEYEKTEGIVSIVRIEEEELIELNKVSIAPIKTIQ